MYDPVRFPSPIHLIFFKDALRVDAQKEEVAGNVSSRSLLVSLHIDPRY
jgi:hypothetical protein